MSFPQKSLIPQIKDCTQENPLKELTNQIYPTFNPIQYSNKSKASKQQEFEAEEIEIQNKLKLYRERMRSIGNNSNNSTDKLIQEYEQNIDTNPEILQLTESGNHYSECKNINCQQFEQKQADQISRLLNDKLRLDERFAQLQLENDEKTQIIQDLQYTIQQMQKDIDDQKNNYNSLQVENDDLATQLNQAQQMHQSSHQQLNELFLQRDQLFTELQQLKKSIQPQQQSSFYLPSICDITYDHSQESIRQDQSFQRNRRIKSLHDNKKGTQTEKIIEDLIIALQVESENQIFKEVQKMVKFTKCIQDMVVKLTSTQDPSIKQCWKWLKRILIDHMQKQKLIQSLKRLLQVDQEGQIYQEIEILINLLSQVELPQ